MKKIKESKQYFVAKNEDVDMFETIDGKKFHNEDEAKKHEEMVLRRRATESKYKAQKVDSYDYGIECQDDIISSVLLYTEDLNEETKNDLIFLYPYLQYSRKINDIKPGWNFFIETEYDSCGIGKWSGYELYVYGLDELIKEREDQLKKLKEIK